MPHYPSSAWALPALSTLMYPPPPSGTIWPVRSEEQWDTGSGVGTAAGWGLTQEQWVGDSGLCLVGAKRWLGHILPDPVGGPCCILSPFPPLLFLSLLSSIPLLCLSPSFPSPRPSLQGQSTAGPKTHKIRPRGHTGMRKFLAPSFLTKPPAPPPALLEGSPAAACIQC